MVKRVAFIFNSLPDDKILDWSRLKTFADDKINVTDFFFFIFYLFIYFFFFFSPFYLFIYLFFFFFFFGGVGGLEKNVGN